MLRKMNGQLQEWIDENGLENEVEDEDYLTDVVQSINDAINKIEQSLGSLVEELEIVCKTGKRLFKCRQINAWEIKPCWNVYTDFKEQVFEVHIEPLEYELNDLEGQLKQLRKDIQLIKQEMYEVDDYLDLSESGKKWFIMLADNISNLATVKPKPLYEGASLLYSVYLSALDYCNCQKNTNLEPCMNELDVLNKAIDKYYAYINPDD